MPLKALQGYNSVIAPLLSDGDWQTLREYIRAGRTALTLPCCQSPCLARESKLGTRHFYHKPGAECGSRGESAEHLLAKDLVLLGCHDSGWDVDTEVAGDGWRADVLAENGKHKIAFEVQWSAQTFEETESRQQRYREDGVRCAWLFRKIPKGSVASKDLPMFQMDFSDRDNPNIDQLPLKSFAQSLLNGQFRFCEQVNSARTQSLAVKFFEYECYRCKRKCHVFLANSEQTGLRSVHGEEIAYLDEGFVNGVDACREVLELIETVDHDESGNPLTLGKVTRRAGSTMNYSSMSQGCPNCNAIFGSHTLAVNLSYETPVLTREITAVCTESIRVPNPHWCYSESKNFCG